MANDVHVFKVILMHATLKTNIFLSLLHRNKVTKLAVSKQMTCWWNFV